MAEPLVSQRDQLRHGASGPRGPLAPRPEVLAGAPAHLGRERRRPTASIPATSRPRDRPTASTPTGSPRRPGTATSSTRTAAFLAQVVDKLAANVRGWQKVYDPDGDGLLRVDSHWWTGMEYQPSFFAFSDYKPSKDFGQPARPVSLERVDLTAYNYGNAVAVARIYRLLGRPDRAKEFDDLAAKIAAAVAGQDVAAGEAVLLLAPGRR